MPDRELLKPEAWPANHRAAMAIIVELDPEGTSLASESPFADEAGQHRLLTMLADLDITPTIVVDTSVPEEEWFALPEGIEVDPAVRLFSAGLLATEQISLKDATTYCQNRLGVKPRGGILPSDEVTASFRSKKVWVMDGSASPYPQRTQNGAVLIPYSPWWQDAMWLAPTNPSPPSAMLESWTLSRASVRSRGELMTIHLAADIAGHPGHVETIQRFLDETVAAGDVWITNGSGIADYVSKHAQHD